MSEGMSFEERWRLKKEAMKKKVTIQDNPEVPDYSQPPPQTINTTRRRDGILYVAGDGPKPAGIMFVMPTLLGEDAIEFREAHRGGTPIPEPPQYMKSLAGVVLKDLINYVGLPTHECYYTAICKWLLPKTKRLKPDRDALEFAKPSFLDELNTVKPKIVVCLGKAAFDFFCPTKYKADDIRAGWFYSTEYDCKYILLDPIHLLSARPDYVEKFKVNLYEVKNMWDQVNGINVNRVPTSYTVVNNRNELINTVANWYATGPRLFAVDCEWGGNNFIDGKLRTIQFCWKEGVAIAVRFMDDKGNYVFDCSYQEVGDILGCYLNKPEVKYIGHHYSADSPWMERWLNLDIYGKCVMDTEFATQCCNEHEDLSLERLALKFTDLGRYDIELMCWKKTNALGHSDGYAFIPDSILLPYSMADVDVTYRAYPHLLRMLETESVLDYYNNIFNPFVTDVFSNFAIVGLPVDTEKLDELRDLFQFAKNELETRFRKEVVKEAPLLVMNVCKEILGDERGLQVAIKYMMTPTAYRFDYLKTEFGIKHVSRAKALHDHFLAAPTFNIRSGIHMARWLFDVKGYTPIKSTNRKEKGFPSMSWDKVMTFPPDVRANYAPAVDKQTLQVFSAKDNVVKLLLEFNAVGNLAKSFLKPAEIDEDTGELIKENGLHFWVASDGRVHYNSSVTETARNRCWKPNVLNWPSYVNKMVGDGILKLFEDMHKLGTLPERYVRYLTEGIPSIRSIITSPPGWKMVETDYATAEIRGLAFISGCKDLIRLMVEPDTQFGFLKSNPKVEVRLNYGDKCGIPPENQHDKFVMAYNKEGEWTKITEEDLLKDSFGNIVHPEKTDLHWSIVEQLKGLPREVLDKKLDRDGKGKVANFSCMAGNVVISTDSGPIQITEINTGHKVWDGVDFVRHEGLIKQGKRIVIQHQGLRATPDHVVWTRDGKPICLIDAFLANVEILRGHPGEHVRLHLESPYCRESPEGVACSRRMQEVQRAFNEMATQLEAWEITEMRMSCGRVLQGHQSNNAGKKVPGYGPTLSLRHTRLQSQLQRTWNRSEVQPSGFHPVGSKNLAGGKLHWQRLRQDRQRRTLRVLQSTSCEQGAESKEHTSVQKVTSFGSRKVQGTSSRMRLHSTTYSQPTPSWEERVGDSQNGTGSVREGPYGPEKGDKEGTTSLIAPTSVGGVSQSEQHSHPASGNLGSGCCGFGYASSATGSSNGVKTFRLSLSYTPGSTKESTLGLQSGVYMRVVTADGRSCDSRKVYLPGFQIDSTSQEIPGDLSGHMGSESSVPDDEAGINRRAIGTEVSKEIEITTEETYDILNAGPRRRFTANGIIVSNCAYGASPNSIERKIEADSGVKPDPGTGQGILDALYGRQPRAMEWLDEQQEIPKNCDHVFLASGRKRHWLGTHSKKNMDYKAWDALMSGQGREARNTPLQESVASTSAIASTRLLKFGRENGLRGRPMVLLYDAVVTLCPDEEVALWVKAHELFMYRATVWRYDDRLLNYPIETEINRGWSSGKIKEDWEEYLSDPKLLELTKQLSKEIEKYTNDPTLGIINK